MVREGGAMEPVGEETTTSTQYLGFSLGGEECGIGILKVREILEYPVLTRVPTTPPWVRGVINLRGGVVPVIDLAVKFGLPESPVTRRTCVIVVEAELEGERTVMGVVADAVSQVIELETADVVASPAFGTSVKVDYLLGLGKHADRFVLLLDTDKVLSAAELMKVASLEELVPPDAVAALGGAAPAARAAGTEGPEQKKGKGEAAP
jgi:purine-binding chemotaxis protein CheW